MQDLRPTLRHARPSDRDAIERLMRLSVRTLCIRDYSARQIAAVEREFGFGRLDEALMLDGTYFVAEMQGAIVGSGGWSRRTKLLQVRDDDTGLEGDLFHPPPGKAAIRAVFVHPEMAGRGLGRLLVRAAEAAARKNGHDAFEIAATLTGVPLYRKLGYRTKGLFSFELNGDGRFAFVLLSKWDSECGMRRAAAARRNAGAGAASPVPNG